MSKAEYAGLSGFFTGMQPAINAYFQDLQNKRDAKLLAEAEAEKNARVDTAKLLSDYAKAGRVAYNEQPLVYENMPTITETLPRVVPLSQRLTMPQTETQIPTTANILPIKLQQQPISYENAPSVVQQPARQASISDIQLILRDIYKGQKLPENLQIKERTIPEGMQIVGYWANGEPKYAPIATADTTEVPIYYASPEQRLTVSAETGEPVTKVAKGGKIIPYTPKVGAGQGGEKPLNFSEKKFRGFVTNGIKDIGIVKDNLNPDVLTQLKISKGTGNISAELNNNPNFQRALSALTDAIGKKTYLESGAAINENESRKNALTFMTKYADNIENMNDRLDLLQSQFEVMGQSVYDNLNWQKQQTQIEQPQVISSKRDKAIQILEDAGQDTAEENINYVMQQLGD